MRQALVQGPNTIKSALAGQMVVEDGAVKGAVLACLKCLAQRACLRANDRQLRLLQRAPYLLAVALIIVCDQHLQHLLCQDPVLSGGANWCFRYRREERGT